MREPRRSALGVLWAVFGAEAFEMDWLPALRAFSDEELRVLKRMLERGVNCPLTSSVGRLFDAVAALAGLRQVCAFEGQAAMQLEWVGGNGERGEKGNGEWGVRNAEWGKRGNAESKTGMANGRLGGDAWSFLVQKGHFVVDWRPLAREICACLQNGHSSAMISRKFHDALADIIVEAARHTRHQRVVLSGGCFQNRLLLESAVGRLESAGFSPVWHQRIPPNDGGISLGQAVIASARLTEGLA